MGEYFLTGSKKIEDFLGRRTGKTEQGKPRLVLFAYRLPLIAYRLPLIAYCLPLIAYCLNNGYHQAQITHDPSTA
jgi:hypothetical protein